VYEPNENKEVEITKINKHDHFIFKKYVYATYQDQRQVSRIGAAQFH
jgi:hypothetical protein